MRKVFTALLCVALAGLLSGCFPILYTINPGVSGTVIDSKSQMPIAGANVTLKTSTPRNKNRQISTVTKDHGEFLISPDQEWGPYIVPMDPLPLSGTVTIQAVGYKELIKVFHTSSMGPGVMELGLIPLESEE